MTITTRHLHIARTAVFAAIAIMAACLTGCRTTKTATSTQEESHWSDLYVPVKLELTEPARMSISGRATMVRDRSIYLSLRMIGMEVATVYVDTDSIFATEKLHKQMLAVDFDKTLGGKLSVGELQDLLLGDPGKAVKKLPSALSYEVEDQGTGGNVTVNLRVTAGKKTYVGRLIWDMGAAQFNTGTPRQWKRPSGYTVIEPSKLPKLLESL